MPSHFSSQFYFTIGNVVFKPEIGIPIGTDPAPYWAKLFPYLFESKYAKQLIPKGFPRPITPMRYQGS